MRPSYPLMWPAGWQRTQDPQWSKFKPASAYSECYGVTHQLELLGADDVVITSNMQYRTDGLPYQRQPNITDTGVAVYFKLNGDEECIPCDKWQKVEENLHAIALTIEALRGLERGGAKDMVNAAFRGFKALPASIIMGAGQPRAWHEVLQVSSSADQDVIKAAYRKLAAKYHPDNIETGDSIKFEEVRRAYDEVRL